MWKITNNLLLKRVKTQGIMQKLRVHLDKQSRKDASNKKQIAFLKGTVDSLNQQISKLRKELRQNNQIIQQVKNNEQLQQLIQNPSALKRSITINQVNQVDLDTIYKKVIQKFNLESTPGSRGSNKELKILQKLQQITSNSKKKQLVGNQEAAYRKVSTVRLGFQASPKQTANSKIQPSRDPSRKSKESQRQLKLQGSSRKLQKQASSQSRSFHRNQSSIMEDSESLKCSNKKSSLSVSIKSVNSKSQISNDDNNKLKKAMSFNYKLSDLDKTSGKERELSKDSKNQMNDFDQSPSNNGKQKNKFKPAHFNTEKSQSLNSEYEAKILDESFLSTDQNHLVMKDSNQLHLPLSDNSIDTNQVPPNKFPAHKTFTQGQPTPNRNISNTKKDMNQSIQYKKIKQKKTQDNLQLHKQISFPSQNEDDIKQLIKDQITKIYIEEIEAIQMQQDPNYGLSIVQIQIVPKKGKSKSKQQSKDSKQKNKVNSKYSRSSIMRQDKSIKSNIRSQVIEEDDRESFDQSDDQTYRSKPPITIENIQSYLDNLSQQTFHSKMQELQEQMYQYPDDFKLLAKDNQMLIDIFKICIGQKIPFDEQQALITSQIEEFGERLNSSLLKYFNLAVQENDDQTQKNDQLSHQGTIMSKPNAKSNQRKKENDQNQFNQQKLQDESDITFSQMIKPILTKQGVLKGVQIRPDVLQIALYEEGYDTKIVKLLIKSICFINRILQSGHIDNFDLKIIQRDMEKFKDVESQVNEKELISPKISVDRTLMNHLLLIEQRLKDYKYDRDMYDRVDAIAEYDSYDIFDHQLKGVYDTQYNKQIDLPLTFGEYMHVILTQVGNQINLLQPDFSEKLVLHNLIDISDEKLKRRKKLINRMSQTQPILCIKSTQTDKKYIYEGENEVAKRSVKMLTIDKFLDHEFAKTLEMFDIFVSQPGFYERQTVKRIQRVIDKLTMSNNSTHLPELDYEAPANNFDDQVQNINTVMDHYTKVIEQRNTLFELIEQFLEKQEQIREAERKKLMESQKNSLLKSVNTLPEQTNNYNNNNSLLHTQGFNTPELWMDNSLSHTMNNTPAQSAYDVRAKIRLEKQRRGGRGQKGHHKDKKLYDQRKRLASLIVDSSTNLSKNIIDKPRANLPQDGNPQFRKMFNSVDLTNINQQNLEQTSGDPEQKTVLDRQQSKLSKEDDTTNDVESVHAQNRQSMGAQPKIKIKYNKVKFKQPQSQMQNMDATDNRMDLPNLPMNRDSKQQTMAQNSPKAKTNKQTQIAQDLDKMYIKKLYSKSPDFASYNLRTPKNKLKQIQQQSDAEFDKKNVMFVDTDVQHSNLSFKNERRPMQTQLDFMTSPKNVSQYRGYVKKLIPNDSKDESQKEAVTRDQSLINQDSKYLSSSKQMPSMDPSLFANSNIRISRPKLKKSAIFNKSLK